MNTLRAIAFLACCLAIIDVLYKYIIVVAFSIMFMPFELWRERRYVNSEAFLSGPQPPSFVIAWGGIGLKLCIICFLAIVVGAVARASNAGIFGYVLFWLIGMVTIAIPLARQPGQSAEDTKSHPAIFFIGVACLVLGLAWAPMSSIPPIGSFLSLVHWALNVSVLGWIVCLLALAHIVSWATIAFFSCLALAIKAVAWRAG